MMTLQQFYPNRHCERPSKALQLLLGRGAAVNSQGGLNGNALQITSRRGYWKIVRPLLKKGAGRGVYTTERSQRRLLLDDGADIHVRGCSYRYALWDTDVGKHQDIQELLMSRGADAADKGWMEWATERAIILWR
nr:uncharacterized protein CTRU02_13245 [Colletotrichum truncatum]KAF6783737.1 hypothetical protein CTRU02_13245 [Colletotrichum truncatum]